jgi:hypothetical protein
VLLYGARERLPKTSPLRNSAVSETKSVVQKPRQLRAFPKRRMVQRGQVTDVGHISLLERIDRFVTDVTLFGINSLRRPCNIAFTFHHDEEQ